MKISSWVILLVCCWQLNANAESSAKPTILALSPHIVEMLFTIGAGKQIIATTDFADYPPQAKQIPRVGNHARLQIEKIVELKPDLIIAWKSGNPAEDLQRLEQLGFKVVFSHPQHLLDVAKEILEFGRLSDNFAQAKQVAEDYSNKLETIRQTYQGKPNVSVFYELWSRPLSTIAKGAWPQLHLDICGASNPFYDAVNSYPQVGIEQVLVKDIQLIIQPLSKGQSAKEGFNWSKWKPVKAVTHNQIITPNADTLHRMTPRLIDELSSMCASIDKARLYYAKVNK
jgi:vitamin B12 transport system substrate-binding protein